MKNHVTELVFILDRSGSMHGLESDTIGGFNRLIDEQKAVKGGCYVTTVLFDHEMQTLHDRVPLKKVKKLTNKDYTVRGMTALMDAIGLTINHIVDIHRHLKDSEVPNHTTFVIITDGLENASRVYNSTKVKAMIEAEKRDYQWEFLFLGANIDAVETAETFGINPDRAVNYHADEAGTQVIYHNLSKTLAKQRMTGVVEEDWADAINEDFINRS